MVVTDATCAYVDAYMPKDNSEKLVFLQVDALVAPILINGAICNSERHNHGGT